MLEKSPPSAEQILTFQFTAQDSRIKAGIRCRPQIEGIGGTLRSCIRNDHSLNLTPLQTQNRLGILQVIGSPRCSEVCNSRS